MPDIHQQPVLSGEYNGAWAIRNETDDVCPIVMKFGGTSVEDARAIRQVADIIAGKIKSQPVVVVSAMAGVTDTLLRLAHAAAEQRIEEAFLLIAELGKHHLTAAARLLPEQKRSAVQPVSFDEIELRVVELLSELEILVQAVVASGTLTARDQDAIASFGERLSSLVVAAALQARGLPGELLDARRFIITDSGFTNAMPAESDTEERTRAILLPVLKAGRIPVTQGFIGSTVEGDTTTLGRGGSDYSAAIIGAALNAQAIEIWTDVDGLMTADPRLVPDAWRIPKISFAEAAELSHFGAKVLHPRTVQPAVERGIPVHIFNTRKPSGEGTEIGSRPHPSSNAVKSITFKRQVAIVTVAARQALPAYEFLHAVCEVINRHRVAVDGVSVSGNSVSLVVDGTKNLEDLTPELARLGTFTVEDNQALLCIVGHHLKFMPGVACRLFGALSRINVHFISQGASPLSLACVIEESNLNDAVTSLHREFFPASALAEGSGVGRKPEAGEKIYKAP